MTLGAQLKSARENKNFTMKKHSDISGLSIGFISQVERGQTDPSISSLKRLAESLGVKMRDLFDQDSIAHTMVKKGTGVLLKVSGSISCELLASSLDKVMEPMIKTILPGGESGLVDPHTGEEFIWIIEGSLQILLGDKKYTLEEGDSFYFCSDQTHAWKNTGSQICRAMWILTPPSYS